MTDYDPYSYEVRKEPYPHFESMRRKCPVHHFVLPQVEVDRINGNPLVAKPTKDFYTLTPYDDVVALLQNHKVFSSAQGPGPERLQALYEGGMLVYADEPHHIHQRRIVNKAFTPKMVEGYLPRIQQVVDDLIDGFEHKGEADVQVDFAVLIPMTIIAEMLGVSMEHQEDFRRWVVDTIAAFGSRDPEAYPRSFVAFQEFAQYFMGHIQVRRDLLANGDELPADLLSALITADYEGRYFADEELIMCAQILMVAGVESTASTIANGVHLLCTHPAELAKLRRDAGLWANAVEEILRLEAPIQGLFRTANEETTIHGCPIPADAKVRGMFASANRDPQHWDAPDDFRVDRDPQLLRQHLSFGTGIHSCLGAALARADIRIALATLFSRLPDLSLDPDDPGQRLDAFLIRGWTSLPVRWTPGLA